MDQVMSERARDHAQFERTVAACSAGLILMDDKARAKVNGGLQSLALPLSRPKDSAVDCFIAPVEVTINGEQVALCAVQETGQQPDTHDLMAMLETAMADSASWLTRMVMEKLKTLRHGKQGEAAPSTSGLELLSDREREVLGLICEGRSDVQMSQLLGLSENTVRNHIASLYRKIGVNRRTAAIIWARERGITSRQGLEVRRRRLPSDRPGKPLSY